MVFFPPQIEGHTVDVPAAPEPPNPAAKCPIYRWNLQNKYDYRVRVLVHQDTIHTNQYTITIITCCYY